MKKAHGEVAEIQPPLLRPHTDSPPPIRETLDRHRAGLLTTAAAVLALVLGILLPLAGYRLDQDPHRILKVVLGGAIFILFVARPTWVPYFLCLMFPYADWLPKSPIPLMNATNLLVIAAVMGIIALTLSRRIRPIISTPVNTPYFVFLGLVIFSFFTGTFLWPDRTSMGMARFRGFWAVLSGLLVFLTTTHLMLTRKQVWRLVGFLIFGSVLGILGPIREAVQGGLGMRTGGGIGDINRMGAYLAFTSVFAFSMIGAYGGAAKAATGIAAVLTGAAMVLPNSRGAYVGFVISAIPQSLRTSIIGTILLGVLLGAGIMAAPSFVKSRIFETVQAGESEDRVGSLDKTSGGRITIWSKALVVIGKNPVIGVGWGNLQQATGLSAGNFKHVHNLYLETAGEMGIVAIIALFWLMFSGWRLGGVLAKREGRTAALGRAYQGVILCLLITNVFGQRFFDFSLSGFFFTLTGCAALEERFTRPDVAEGYR
jgi:hypothetical protein